MGRGAARPIPLPRVPVRSPSTDSARVSPLARALCAAAALACVLAPSAAPASSPLTRQVGSYRSATHLAALARSGARVVRPLRALRTAVVESPARDLPSPVLRLALSVDEPAL